MFKTGFKIRYYINVSIQFNIYGANTQILNCQICVKPDL